MSVPRHSTDTSGEQALGRRFLEAREAAGLTTAQVASATKMMKKHVMCMESGDFAALGAPIYAKGFLKLYAEYLRLDIEDILDEYARLRAPRPPAPEEEAEPSVARRRARGKARNGPSVPAFWQQAVRAVRDARQWVEQIPREKALLWLRQAGAVVLSLLLLAGMVFLVRGCMNAGQRRRALSDRRERDRMAVLQEVPAPYLEKEQDWP